MTEEKFYRVGIILKTQGLKGEVKVKETTDFADERFKLGTKLWVKSINDFKELTIAKSRLNKGFRFLQFAGLNDINLVEQYVKHELYIEAEERSEELNENEFYVDDLIDLPVVDLEDKPVGTLKEVLAYGPNDVWVVRQKNGKEILLPYTADFIKEVDVDNQRIIIDLALYNES